MHYINNGKLWDDHRIRKFIERQQRLQKQMGHCLWVIELQQKEGLIGFCGIAPFEPSGFLEIGWWLDESCWGQGFATEAAKVFLDYAINVLGITQLRSVSHRDHSGSQAVMRRIGMRHEQDLLLGDFGKEPEDLPIRVHLYDQKQNKVRVISTKQIDPFFDKVSQSSLTGSEDRAPNPDHGRPFQDCPGVIGSHPHRKLIDLRCIEVRL